MPKGVVLLLSVMVIGSVVIAMALAVSFGGIGRTTTVLHASQAIEARLRTSSCLDEVLIWLSSDPSWTQTSVTTSEGTCATVITNPGGNTRVVKVGASEDNVFYGLRANLTVDPVLVTAIEAVLP